MMKKQHLNFASAFYYLQLDGCGHQPLFSEQAECELFKELLSQFRVKFSADLLAYCLLQDSFHLILKTGPDGCDVIGDWLVESYTEAFNLRHQRHGSVFQPDYVATLLEPSRYLLPVVQRLHNLPVVKQLVPHAAIYRWSSHRDYLNSTPPLWIRRDQVLERLTPHRGSRQRRYEDFIEIGTSQNIDWINGNHKKYYALASEHYLQLWFAASTKNSLAPTVELTELAHWVCQQTGLVITDLQLRRRHRLGHEVRATIAALAEALGIAEVASVADFLEMDREALSGGVRAVKTQRAMYLLNMLQELRKFIQTRQLQSVTDDNSTPPISSVNTLQEPNIIGVEVGRTDDSMDYRHQSDNGTLDGNFAQISDASSPQPMQASGRFN